MGLLGKIKSAATKSASFFTTGSPDTFGSDAAAQTPAPQGQTPAATQQPTSSNSNSSSTKQVNPHGVLYKPSFSHGGGGVVLDTPASNIVVKDPSGKVIYQGKASRNSEGSKFQLPVNKIPPGSTFSVDGGPDNTIKDPGSRIQFNSQGEATSTGGKGSIGAGGGSSAPGYSGSGGAYGPNQLGYGVAPADLTGQFPGAAHIPTIKIPGAQLPFVDPTQFAQGYAKTINSQAQDTYNTSSDLALKELNTELQGMQNYVPAAQALKQSTISVDNIFNQNQRAQQVNQTLPGVNAQLDQQGRDASAYAAGRIPDSVADNALSVNAASTSADRSSTGGFGASSSVARKASDLESANQRVALSQYGNQLLDSNINAKSSLNLAPTEYSNAGSTVSAVPSLSGSQLAGQNQSTLLGYGSLPVGSALSTQVGENEFSTNLNQNTQQFNANLAQTSNTFNASADNNFALSKFGYQVGEAGAVAGAAQTDINTQVGLQQQQQYNQLMQQYLSQSQNSQLIGGLFQGASALFGGSGGLSGITSSLGSLGGKGEKGAGQSTAQVVNGVPAVIGVPAG